MNEPRKTVGAAAAVTVSAAVLAAVRDGTADLAGGAVLVVSMGALARAAMRAASDAATRRYREP